jgi:hypothetical protein
MSTDPPAMNSRRKFLQTSGLGIGWLAMLDLLQQASQAHFDKLIEIAGGNSQEFYALEQRVRSVARFFQHAAIEGKPRLVTVEIVARIVEGNS